MQFRQQCAMDWKPRLFLRAPSLSVLIYGPAARSDATASHVATISPADLESWEETRFSGRTLYRVERTGRGPALHAIAGGSASGLCREVDIDLGSQPIVRWSWRLDRAPPRSDERAKEGDDQGLRLSFLAPRGGGDDAGLAIQYVWSQNEPAGALWPNAFVPQAYQVAARSGPAEPGRWRSERRDLAADFRAAFDLAIERVDAVCLMSDGDQTGALVEGWYGDITFQAR